MSTALATPALAECEEIIERGLATFIEVGQALARIREERLYRESHETFEDYCRERWDFTDRRARQLMGAAEIGTVVPVGSERVARELSPLCDKPEELREAWTEAVETHGDHPTAAAVREVVQSRVANGRPQPKCVYCPTCGSRVRADRPMSERGSK